MLQERCAALEGIRVLDLTIVTAGPGATAILADMGAEVIKIESTNYYDDFRNTAVWPDNDPGERPYNRAAPFNTLNRNKYDVTLDLKKPRGREILLELAKHCDIVAENFRSGVLESLGLSYPVFKAIKPEIVMISVSSQGTFGPEATTRSYGSTLDALSGLAYVTGYEDGPPGWSGQTVNYPDQLACTLAAGAVMAGLHHRLRTGEGCYVDFSQRESITSVLGEMILDYSVNNRPPRRIGNGHPDFVPHGCYPSAGDDKWVTLAVQSDEEWPVFCRAIGRTELANDARFASHDERYRNRAALDEVVSEWTRRHSPAEAFRILADAGIAAAPVNSGKGVLEDPHLWERGFYNEVPQTEAGTHPIKTLPMKLSKLPGTIHMPAPLLGEHNKHVLGSLLGLSVTDLADLEREGIIGTIPLMRRSPSGL